MLLVLCYSRCALINQHSAVFFNPLSSGVMVAYMSLQHSGSEIKWVDGGKTLFKVSTHLVSTVYTQVRRFNFVHLSHLLISLQRKVRYMCKRCVFFRISTCTTSSTTVKAWSCQNKLWKGSW